MQKLESSCPAFQGHSSPSELTLIDRLTHDFILMFHGPISYRFQDVARYWPKIASFSEPTFI